MHRLTGFLLAAILLSACNPKIGNGLRRNDLKKDVSMETDKGTVEIRLSDATPLHRDNFLKLVKSHYYDGMLFHRVISHFMIQSGDPDSKNAKPGQVLGNGGPAYTIPAEFRPELFHKKGVIAAARTGDDVNPSRASSGSQFYIVQGRRFSDAGLDSVELYRLAGRKISETQRQVYKTVGGAPHLDQGYTVFGEVVKGLAVIDSIAAAPTGGYTGADRPLRDIRIRKAFLVKRK